MSATLRLAKSDFAACREEMAAVLGNLPVAKGSLFVPETAAWAFPEPRLCVRPV